MTTTTATRRCAFPPCDERLGSIHGNALYCSPQCKTRASRLARLGEISLECPRCHRHHYVWTVSDGDSCLACGYYSGADLSLDGIRVVEGRYEREKGPGTVADHPRRRGESRTSLALERAATIFREGISIPEAAARWCVSERTVLRYLTLHRDHRRDDG